MEQKVEKQASLESVPVKRLKRELKYQGTILKMYEDTVEVNGHQAKWDFIHHDGAAAVLPVTEDGKILMVRQYRNALDRYTLEIPAGSRDSTEEATSVCAARELEEETGYRAAKMELLITVSTTVAFCNETIDVYLATELTPTQQHLDEDEFVEVECFTIDELKDMVLTQKIQDSKTAAAIMAYYGKYCID